MSNHLSSFEAIVIFFPDLPIADTKKVRAPGQTSAQSSHAASQPLRRSVQEELHPKDRAASCGTPTHQVTCQKQEDCNADCSDPHCPGDGGSDCRALSDAPATRCLCSGPGRREREGCTAEVRVWTAFRLPDLLGTF